MGKNIKIFTSFHKECELFESEIVKPIQVGTALNGEIFAHTLHDNTGDNISEKNRSYCELTAQYWAWKNVDADYYGFMHYRRYFSFNPIQLEEDNWGNIVLKNIDKKNCAQLRLDDRTIQRYVENVDVITTKGEFLKKYKQGKTVYEHYKLSPYHKIEDLDIIIDIIEEKYPEYIEAMQEYLNSNTAYFCNMYILKREIFEEYSAWLFDVLSEHEKRQNFSNYDINEYRVSGFLAERLWGIYYTYLKKQNKYVCKELQKSLFKNTNIHDQIMPKYETNNIPIVFAADNNYVPYLSVTIRSIVDNASKEYNYDLIILNSDIQENNKKALLSEINYYPNFSIRFYDVTHLFSDRNLRTSGHITVETYYRLAMQTIMEQYNKVIYLDSDLVVLNDISELYNVDLENYLLAAVSDIDSAGCYNGADVKRKTYLEKYMKLQNPYHYFNAGVLVMNLKEFRKTFSENEILELAAYQEWLFMDQDVLNKVCENKVLYLNNCWNMMINWKTENDSRERVIKKAPYWSYLDYMDARKSPKIIHYAGFQKPWDECRCDGAEYFWQYARKTALYEELLARLQKKTVQASISDGMATELSMKDAHGIHLAGVTESVYVDGLFVKMINLINKKFPKDSKRRELVKKIAGKFIR